MLTIRPRTPEDDERIVAIRNAIHPDHMPLTVEEQRHSYERQPADAYFEMHVAERRGKIVGYATWSRQVYTVEENTYWTILGVDPPHWGEGIGSTLYEMVLDNVRDRGARLLKCGVREDLPRALQFAQNRGFTPTGHGNRYSRLDVGSAQLERCRVADERARQEGIRLATLTELGETEELLRSIWKVDDEATPDVPGSEDWRSIPFEDWRRWTIDLPGVRPDIFWVALDGEEVVGLCILELHGERSAYNTGTAVARSHRKRGIARALKFHSVVWAQANGLEAIYTDNDVENKPMLAINMDLGYRPLPASLEMVKTL